MLDLNKRILGVHEHATPAETTTAFPGATWAREFVAGPKGPLPESTTTKRLIELVMQAVSASVNAGGGCVVSVKLDMRSAAKGNWDARLTALGKAMTGLRVVVIVWHEPEDDLTGQVFANGFNRARRALKAGWADLQVAYCAMAYQWRPESKTTADPRVWRSVDADLYLVDVYSGKSFEPTAILPEHSGFLRWYVEIAAVSGRRWGVAERGWLAGPDRAATIAREAEWLATDPVGKTCAMYLAWSTGGTENNSGWVLDQPTRDAVAALIRRLDLPTGYRLSPIDGVLIHEPTGVLVAADLTSRWDSFTTGR